MYKGDFLSFKYDGKGILYYENNKKIKFDGLFKEGYFVKGILYNYQGYKQYEGEFNNNNQYEGNGILYYGTNNKIYYSKGIFKEGKIIKGILYDIEGQKMYEGEIRNNLPKECKNFKLYKLNGELVYIGNILDCNYHGNGKLYEDDNIHIFEGIFFKGNKVKGTLYEKVKDSSSNDNLRKKYEGEYKNDKFNGYGKFYVLDSEKNNYLYYEGNFKDNEISGDGIKYYKNGLYKLKGKFENIFICEGLCYDPFGEIIIEGKIFQNIPFDINQSYLIFNDNGDLIYSSEYYRDEVIKNGRNFGHNLNENIPRSSVVLISTGYPGKTAIINRLIKIPILKAI